MPGHDGSVDVWRRFGKSTALGAASGAVTVEQVFCLGNCALGPSVTVNGRLHGRVDADYLRAILGEAMSA